MTVIDPAPPLVGPQPPVEPQPPAPKRHVAARVAAAVGVAAVLAGAGFFAHQHLTGTGTAATAEAATSMPACDPNLVTVHPVTHNGVALGVTASGPNVVQIDVWNTFEHRRYFQQVTARGDGASFAMWDFRYTFDRIDVTLKTGGTCTVTAGILDELNRVNGWTR